MKHSFSFALQSLMLILLSSAATPHAVLAQTPPLPGEVIFSELMIAPKSAGGEWIEVYSRALEARSLEGCILKEGTSGTCALDGSTSHCHKLPAGTPVLAPGGFALLAFDASALATSCALSGATDYQNLTLNNSGAETLELSCPDGSGGLVQVASFTYQWDKVEGALSGRSWMLHQDHLQDADVSSPSSWCVAPAEALFCQSNPADSATQDFGTPGGTNLCPTVPTVRFPAPGEVVFSELNIWPTSSTSNAEWIELHVVQAATGDGEIAPQLNGCELKSVSCSALSVEQCLAQVSPVWSTTAEMLSGAPTLTLQEGQDVLLVGSASKTCVAWDPLDPAACVLQADGSYSKEVLFNSDVRLLELSCPDVDGVSQTIDRVVYSKPWVDDACDEPSSHCSWAARPEALDATLNDDPLAAWGASTSDSSYVAAHTESAPVYSWGTPGAANQVPPYEPVLDLLPGDVVFSEVATWPSTTDPSADWLELTFPADPVGGVWDLAACTLRTVPCPVGVSAEACVELPGEGIVWNSSDTPAAIGEGLTIRGAGFALLGTSSTRPCVESDEAGACVQTVNGTLTLSLTGTVLLELACPDAAGTLTSIDRMVYSAAWAEAACLREDLACSWELRPALDAERGMGRTVSGSIPAEVPASLADNDSPLSWGAASQPYLTGLDEGVEVGGAGSPGVVSALDPPIPGVTPGQAQVVFSELMIDPATSNPEWLELTGVGGDAPYELAGCLLLLADESNTGCTPELPGTCKEWRFPAEVSLQVGDAEQVLLSKSSICLSHEGGAPTGLAGEEDPACTLTSDLRYGTLDFSTTKLQQVALWCPSDAGWVRSDSFIFSWSAIREGCTLTSADPDAEPGGCSLSVHQDYIGAETNDDSFYQCVSPAVDEAGQAQTWVDLQGRPSTGTPGQPNRCWSLPVPPPEGALVFSELMVAPRGFSEESGYEALEWFELHNPSGEAYDFRACELLVGPELSDGVLNLGEASAMSLESSPARIEAGDWQLWGPSGCLVRGPQGCVGDDSTFPLLAAEQSYEGLNFVASSPQILLLRCLGPGSQRWTVDQVRFDYTTQIQEDGRSWQLSPDAQDALANDQPEAWCVASYQQPYYTTDAGCNYGTPGEANACPAAPVYTGDIGPGCRCSVGDDGDDEGVPQSVSSLALLGLVVAWRRRRCPSGGLSPR